MCRSAQETSCECRGLRCGRCPGGSCASSRSRSGTRSLRTGRRVNRLSLVGLVAGGLAALVAEQLGLNATVSFWGDPGPFVLLCALVSGILWRTPLRHVIASLTAALALLWLVVAFTPFAAWLGRDLT